MGPEAYGLVGFFTMMQIWFNLLDMGLTPTVARETARFRGGVTDALSYRRLLRALQIIFLAFAFIGCIGMIATSALIANKWLNVKDLPFGTVKDSLKLMAVCIALRWLSGFYRGCVSGFEKLVWLGGFNFGIVTLRFLCVIPILIFVGNSPVVFFAYQIIVALLELSGLVIKSHGLIPKVLPGERISWEIKNLFNPIKSVLKFAAAIAFTSSVWVLVTQSDKLILSKLLTLADFGYFTLAVLAANGVMMLSGPVSSALMPRMAKLHAEGDDFNLIELYRNATQMVAAIAVSACFVLAFFAEKILWMWTGDLYAASVAGPILRLYALGNGFLAMAAFPYYLQFAKGDLKLHLIGNFIFVILLVPTSIWATWEYGAIGAGYAWFCANGIYFFFWVPIVHRRFFDELHKNWIFNDLFPIISLALTSATGFYFFVSWPVERLQCLWLLLALSMITLLAGSLGSNKIRNAFIIKINKSINGTQKI